MVEQVGVGSATLGCGFDGAFPSTTSSSNYAPAHPLRFTADTPSSSAPGLSRPRMLKQRRRNVNTGRMKVKGAAIGCAGCSDLPNDGSGLAPGGFQAAENGARDFIFATGDGSCNTGSGPFEYNGCNIKDVRGPSRLFAHLESRSNGVCGTTEERVASCSDKPSSSSVFAFGIGDSSRPTFGRGSSFSAEDENPASRGYSSVEKGTQVPFHKVAAAALSQEMEKLNVREPSGNGQAQATGPCNNARSDLKGVFVFGATGNGMDTAPGDNQNCSAEQSVSAAKVPVEDGQPAKDDKACDFVFLGIKSKHATSNCCEVNGISNKAKTRHKNIRKKTVSERRRLSQVSSSDSSSSYQVPFQAHKPEKESIREVDSSKPNDCGEPNVPSSSFRVDSVAESLAAMFTAGKTEVGSVPHFRLQTAKNDTSLSFQDNLFAIAGQNLKFCIAVGGSNAKMKKRTKMSKKPPGYQKPVNNSVHMENGSQQSSNLDSPGSYSPMDLSPCPGTSDTVKISNAVDSSQAGSVSFRFHRTSNDIISPSPMEEGSISNPGNKCQRSQNEFDNNILDNDHIEEVPEFSRPDDEKLTVTGVVDSVHWSNSETRKQLNFTFAAVHSTSSPLSASKHRNRRKKQVKVGHDLIDEKFDLSSIASVVVPFTDNLGNKDFVLDKGNKEVPVGFSCKDKSELKKEQGDDRPSSPATCFAAEACKKWRLRGNQAYEQGQLAKAEEYYTRGLSCISLEQGSKSYIGALALCYSNRAATRMTLGRMREAISDCMSAIAKDPNFHKAKVRAANCHLALGEAEESMKLYNKCLQSGIDTTMGVKITKEASEGLQKAKQVMDYIGQINGLLLSRGLSDMENALKMISNGLSISPLSEILIKMKAETLLKVGRFGDVIKVCEETADSAERNSSMVGGDEGTKNGYSGTIWTEPKIWRLYLISKSYFCLGKLEEVLNLIPKNELGAFPKRQGDKTLESLASLSSTVQELLRLKAAGNTDFQAGRYLEAVNTYTATLASSIESRPFSAICFCNRAAAYQALGQMTEAIADCSLAIALDQSYLKAISRRATLYEVIRDYEQATADLKRLILLLEKKSNDKSLRSGSSGRSTGNKHELKQAQSRLAAIEEKSKSGRPLDMYMILGIESSCSAADIKKAYRKAALKHHPDKAGQCLVRSENGDDSLWKDVADEVQKDASSLFKMIGEAYAVLSDPTKRLQYDEEENMREILKKDSGWGSTTRSSSYDQYGHNYHEKHDNRPREQWKSYKSRNQKSSEYHSWSSQHF